MSRTKLIAAAILVAVVGAIAWLVVGGGPSGQAGAQPSATVPPVAESTTVTTDARAVPVRHAELAAPAGGGVVAEVLVAEGDTVTADQPLLRLEGAQAQAAVDEAGASVGAAGAALKRAQAGEAQAGFEEDSAQAAVREAQAGVDAADATRDGTPSSGSVRRAANAEVDRARAALRAARAQALAARSAHDAAAMALAGAQADLDRADAVLAGAQAALDDLTLRAPFAGTVASLDAVVGETVDGAAPVARIADLSAWQFESIDLDEAAIGRLDVGAHATITVDAFADVEIPATVASISGFGQSSAGDIVYTVVLEPSGPLPEGLRWNMTASAQIDAAR
jgi:multidrug resistance efflux pump